MSSNGTKGAVTSTQGKQFHLPETPRFNQLVSSISNQTHQQQVTPKRAPLHSRLNIPFFSKKNPLGTSLAIPVVEAVLNRDLDSRERWALENMRPIPPEGLPLLHLMWRKNQWSRALGNSRFRLIMDLFLGLKEPKNKKQGEAWKNLQRILNEYLNQGDEEWRTEIASSNSPGAELAHWSKKNREIIAALDVVLKAWRWGSINAISANPLSFAYSPGEHLDAESGAVLLPREIVDQRWGNLRYDLLHMMFYLASEVQRDEREREALGKDCDVRYLEHFTAAYTPGELALVEEFSLTALENHSVILSLLPHAFQLNWSTLLELSTLAHEYNGEWAVAAMDWNNNSYTESRSDA